MLELALQTKAIRRRHGPDAERALADLFFRTEPGRGAAAGRPRRRPGRSKRWRARRSRRSRSRPRPARHTISINTDRAHLTLSVDRGGVQVDRVEVGGVDDAERTPLVWLRGERARSYHCWTTGCAAPGSTIVTSSSLSDRAVSPHARRGRLGRRHRRATDPALFRGRRPAHGSRDRARERHEWPAITVPTGERTAREARAAAPADRE